MKEAREGFKERGEAGEGECGCSADDMVLVADSEESLQTNLKKLDETLMKWE